MDEPRHRGLSDAISMLASGGWATHDPDILAELVEEGAALARLALADPRASQAVHAAAQAFLAGVEEETRPPAPDVPRKT